MDGQLVFTALEKDFKTSGLLELVKSFKGGEKTLSWGTEKQVEKNGF